MSDTDVRVRFAPSPTGYLHVGGARTAIFNWLFARHHKGAFVLRIEDTDIERSTPESEAALIDDLRWLGLDWDEGPGVGGSGSDASGAGGSGSDGDCGPYRQSERLDIYREHAARLVADGHAFPCFCPDEVLSAKREAAMAAGKPPQYDGTCRSLSSDEVAARRAEGIPEVVRFVVPSGDVRFADLIRGDIKLETNMVGDFVIVRSNGNPTYNFAAAIDDHLMRITHVLRGEEHLPNTLRQILIYQAFGFDVPQFAHLSLILAEDKSKLSKRHGATSVQELSTSGYLPGAVLNYLVLLGWSHPEEKEVLSIEELVASYSLDRVSKAPSVYDRDKLRWMNGQYIRATDVETLFDVADSFFPDHVRDSYDRAGRVKILELLHEKIETFAELYDKSSPFRSPPVFDDEALQILDMPEAQAVLKALAGTLDASTEEFTGQLFKTLVKQAGKETGQKGKALFFPVRAALTGSVHGPDLAGIAELKGKEEVIRTLVGTA
jgi:nondiscriminating glutamyl-tRNA synthetase